jgi:2-isopropylmalate synthase
VKSASQQTNLFPFRTTFINKKYDPVSMVEKPEILDTTLRDGLQGGLVKDVSSFTQDEGLRVIELINKLGYADVIEAGFAGQTPAMDEWIKNAAARPKNNIAVFGGVRKPNSSIEDYDTNFLIRNMAELNTQTVVLVGKCWDYLIKPTLRTTPEENLRMIKDTVEHFIAKGKRVIFDAEFASNGFLGKPGIKPNFDYTLQAIETAVDAGSNTVVLCDTTGILLPQHVQPLLDSVLARIDPKVKVGMHAHNDHGLAAAISYLAWLNGARHLQVTMNGLGERTGNASAIDVLSLLNSPYSNLRVEYNLKDAKEIADELFSMTSKSLHLPPNTPHVGKYAFASKAGMHLSANMRLRDAYNGRKPEEFGNTSITLFSSIMGRAGIAELFGVQNEDRARQTLKKAKELTKDGYDFQEAAASLRILYEKIKNEGVMPIVISPDYKIEDASDISQRKNRAFVKIIAHGKELKAEAESSEGPFDALAKAALSSVISAYKLPEFYLVDYSTRIIKEKGTASVIGVLIEFRINNKSFKTMGVSHSVLDASRLALEDGINYALLRK